MSEMLLINPRVRRKARRNPASVFPRAANPKRRRRASKARARNPVSALRRRVMARKNPIRASKRRHHARRRRNPISMGSITNSKMWMDMLKEAGIGAVGSVAVDYAMGYLKAYLPTSLQQSTDPAPQAYDAVKAVVTVAAGVVLNKTTKGLSIKAARGALTVQLAQLLAKNLPASMLPANGLGFYSPGAVVQGNARVAPVRISRSNAGMNAYMPSGSPLLSGMGAYTRAGSPLLSGGNDGARGREGVSLYK